MTFADLSGLPSVSFAPQSAGETETAIITAYEAIAKATLQPGDPVRLFLESLAYILSVQNGLIDLAGKQNLLAYARGGHLDHLGAPMGVIRIQPQPARTTVRFGVDEALDFAVPIPAGTRVTTQSGGSCSPRCPTPCFPRGSFLSKPPRRPRKRGPRATACCRARYAASSIAPLSASSAFCRSLSSPAVHHAGEQRGHHAFRL